MASPAAPSRVRGAAPCLVAALLTGLAGCGAGVEPQAPVRSAPPAGYGRAPTAAGGYIAGIAVPSRALYDALLPPPHDPLSLGDIQCPSCRAAIAGDGLCGHCGVGWVAQRCYVNRVSYYVARGNPLDAATPACTTCRENSRRLGWCDRCRVGMLGDLAYRDRRLYDEAVPWFEILLASVAKLKDCETCALAMTCDGTCPVHWASYRAGQVVREDSQGPAGRSGS